MFDSGIGFIDKYIRESYVCTKEFNTINVGDVVKVDFNNTQHNRICITANRHSYFVKSLTLDTHFEKVV